MRFWTVFGIWRNWEMWLKSLPLLFLVNWRDQLRYYCVARWQHRGGTGRRSPRLELPTLFYQGGYMLIPRCVVLVFSLAGTLLGAGSACGQSYPYKALRIVTSGVGGGSDFVARQIAPGISGPLGQPVIVENRGGGGIGTGEIVAQASADGYTLIVGSNSLWIAPLLQKLPFDGVRDFAPITTTTEAPLVLVVNPSLPVASVKELIALAKAKPGALNYASGNTGASNNLAGEMFKSLAGINIVRIPYKGGGAAMNDVIGGQDGVVGGGERV